MVPRDVGKTLPAAGSEAQDNPSWGPTRYKRGVTTHLALLEDDPLTRTALAGALRALADIVVVVETGSPQTFLETVKRTRVDAGIFDLHIGDGPSGIEVAHAARRVHPVIGVVFLTSLDDPRLLSRPTSPLPSGSEYLVKKDVGNLGILREAIHRAISRAGSPGPKTPSKAEAALTDHQLDILRLVAEGLSNKEIARARSVTEKSVEQTIARLAKSLGLVKTPAANQRVQLVRAYFRALGANLP